MEYIMKKITLSLLSIVSFLTLHTACGAQIDHYFCTDNEGREFHIMKDDKSLAFSGKGTHGLHGGILKKSKTTPHKFIGTLSSLTGDAVIGVAELPQTEDLEADGVTFTITRMDETPQRYPYACRKVNFAAA